MLHTERNTGLNIPSQKCPIFDLYPLLCSFYPLNSWHLYMTDTIVSIIISILVLYSPINITNAAVRILMGVDSENINIYEVKDSICTIEDVNNPHDLHVWNINSQFVSLSVRKSLSANSCWNLVDT